MVVNLLTVLIAVFPTVLYSMGVVPRTVPVRSIGFVPAPLESGGDSDLMLANGTC